MDADHWSSSIIEENIGGQGLFSAKSMVFLNRVTEKVEAKDSLVDFLEVMKESQNVFVILEGKVNADLKKGFDRKEESGLIDAFSMKDHENLWEDLSRRLSALGIETGDLSGRNVLVIENSGKKHYTVIDQRQRV